MLELIGTKEYSTISAANPYAERTIASLREAGVSEPWVAEIGVGIGATTVKIVKALDNKGRLHIFDFTEKVAELVADFKALGYNNVEGFGNTSKHWDSYNWTLGKFLLQGKRAIYDYIYLDGSHTFAVDGLAFFLCDLLLKPGGILEFDDYGWRFKESGWMKDTRHEFMTEEQIDTRQVAMVIDLFLKGNPNYEVVRDNRIYKKRGVNESKGS